LLVAACVVPSAPIFVTLMKEASGRRSLQEPHGVTTQKTPFFSDNLFPFVAQKFSSANTDVPDEWTFIG
jgi:hypothetical protein